MHELLFLGDSHSGVLRRFYEARGGRAHGGILQTGKQLEGDIVAVNKGKLRFTTPRAQERYRNALDSAGIRSILDADMPIVSTFGFNTHRFMKGMEHATVDPAEDGKQFLSRAVFEAIVAAGRASALAFYRHLRGKQVFAVHSPQRAQPPGFRLSVAGDDLFAGWLREAGVEVIDVRPQTTDEHGHLRQEFWGDTPGDRAHANARYVDLVLAEIERRLGGRELADAAE